MTETPPPSTSTTQTWVKVALFVSLAINLLVVGLVVGSLMSPESPRKRNTDDHRALRGIVSEPYVRALPDEARRDLARSVTQNRDDLRGVRSDMRARFESLLVALRSGEFDRAEISALLSGQRDAAFKRSEFGQELLLDQLEAMSASERAAYADALERNLPKPRRR